MESYIENPYELKPLQRYKIVEIWNREQFASLETYFFMKRGECLLFLIQGNFLPKKAEIQLLNSHKSLKCYEVMKKSRLRTGYWLLVQRQSHIKLIKTYGKLREIPEEINFREPIKISVSSNIAFRQHTQKRKEIESLAAPCYSYFKLNAVSDNDLFASTFQTKHNKFNPILPKQRIEYRQTLKNGMLVQKKLSNYFQAKYNLTHYKQDRSLHFIGVDQTQTKFVFELINGFKYALKDYFKGDSLYFSVESKLVSGRKDYCKLNFKLEEAKRSPKFVLFHVTKAHSEAEGMKIKLFNEDRKVNLLSEIYNGSRYYPQDYFSAISSLFSNCSYLFEYDLNSTFIGWYYSTYKPCLLTVIYLFEEDKQMIVKETVTSAINVGKTMRLGRRPTEMLLEMLISK